MPEGPFGGPRPFAENSIEVNIYFKNELYDKTLEYIYKNISSFTLLEGPVKGPVGTQNNVVTLGLSGNQITMNSLKDTKVQIESIVSDEVEDIEVII